MAYANGNGGSVLPQRVILLNYVNNQVKQARVHLTDLNLLRSIQSFRF